MKRVNRMLSLLLAMVMVFTMIPTTVFAASPEMTLRASQVSALSGSTVDVTLDLEGNPGLAAMKVKVAFDSEILTLTNVAFNEGMGGQYQMPQTMNSPVSLTWYNGAGNFTEANANFATLTFRVSETAYAGDVTELSVTYNPSDIYDITETDIALNVINGSVTILDCVPGDINGDGVANLKDQTRMFQYLADWEVEVNELVLDTNGDGSVNLKDQTRLFQYLADWDVEIWPKPVKRHTLVSVEQKSATCTEDGNIAYWHCTDCGKYFTNEAGTGEITQEATIIAALGHTEETFSQSGYTDGVKCSTCGEIFVEPTPIVGKTRTVNYVIDQGRDYIKEQMANQNIVILNTEEVFPASEQVNASEEYDVPHPYLDGYTFLGWYDLPEGDGAEIVKTLSPSEKTVTLYAHWAPTVYDIKYKSNLSPIPKDTYTVETGAILDAPPKVSNYVFAGWSDSNGKMYDKDEIPVGTTGNITLTANWISERNKTITKNDLGDPLIYEDDENGFIYFAYEIGRIENVPLSVIHDFGYLSSDGPIKTWTNTDAVTTEESMMETYSKVVSEATIQSSNWTLSNGWSENTSIDQEWLKETNLTQEEAEERGKTESGEWYTGSSYGGSKDTTKLDTTESGWTREVKIENSTAETEESKTAMGVSSTIGAEMKVKGFGGLKAEATASVDLEDKSSTTNTYGFSAGGAKTDTTFHTDSTVTNSNWNNSESYTSSQTSSTTETMTRALSELVAENHHYGESYIKSEDTSKTQGTQSSSSSDEEYSTSVTYSKIEVKTKSETWSTEVSTSGYYRWILAGTAHVYGVVGYDIANDAFFVNTLTVMDDETHEMQDYSYASAAYSDNQNGVISFAVPFEVAEYVAEKVCGSDGLNVNQATGEITAYTGIDNCVVIPEYMSVGDDDVIKVTGLGSKNGVKAFADNSDVVAVILSDHITEIPEGAFKNCTALEGVLGGSITAIYKDAFSGCSSLAEVGVSSKVTLLEEKAFVGVNKLIAAPSKASVLNAAVNSGAKSIVINLSEFANDDASLNGLTITVPEGTEYFELNGYGKSFTGFTIVSNADKTVIKKVSLNGTDNIPLTVSSPEVELNQVSVQASGMSLVLSADSTRLGLQSTINATTVKCRDLELYETHTTVDGLLSVSDTLYTTNTEITGQQYLSCTNIVKIEDSAFDGTLHTCMVNLDAYGGIVSESEANKTVTIGKEYGTLPVPTREGYDFIGWFTAKELGEQVTESDICKGGITLYAHWSVKEYSVSWTGLSWCNIAVTRTASPYKGAATGALSNGATIYYGDELSVTYTQHTAYSLNTRGASNITVTGDVNSAHIYATGTVKRYIGYWNQSANFTITVTRTASPYANDTLGVLPHGCALYYGDELSIAYTAKTGYIVKSHGPEKITVTKDVKPEDLPIVVEPDSYTYKIVYKSSNGTDLGGTTVTNTYGSTKTITAPAKSGYDTPASQTIKWDATSKTITFEYKPTDVGYTTETGTAVTTPTTTFRAEVQHRNRTKESVQIRVVWTDTIKAYGFNEQSYKFDVSCNGVSGGRTTITNYYDWGSQVSYERSKTGESVWMTVPVNATTTSVTVRVTHMETNIPGTVLGSDYSAQWVIPIPTY